MATATPTKKPAQVTAPQPTAPKNGAVKPATPTKVATTAPVKEPDKYQRFVDLDKATWSRIVEYSKQAERDLDDIVAEIQETAEATYLQQYPEENRPLWAMRIVASKITVEGLTSADAFLLLVLDVEAPTAVKTKNGVKNVATIRGIVSKYDEKGEAGDAAIAEVAFWEEEADKVNDAQIGQAYDVKLAGNYKDGRFQLKGTPKTNWNKKTELDVEPLSILQELYPKTDLADIAEAATKKRPILVNAQVTFSRSGKGASGKPYGLITIYDESQRVDERGISVFTSPQNAVHGTGSRLWILGTVSPGKKNPETGEAYAPSMNALAIIPEFSIPVAFTKQTTIESKTIGEDDQPEAVDFTSFKKKATEAPASPVTEEATEEEEVAEEETAETTEE